MDTNTNDREDPQPDRGKGPPEGKGRPEDRPPEGKGRPTRPHRSSAILGKVQF